MRKGLAALLILGLAVAITLPLHGQGKDKDKGKKEVATDPEKAGPDYAIQGEYVGTTVGNAKFGAEVVAEGDGKFLVNFLPGGLRGDGGDYSKHIKGSAQRKKDEDLVTVKSKDGKWKATIASGQMKGTTGE